MKKETNKENKKNILGKILFSKITLFTSILIIVIALALSANAATVRVQSGNLNVSNNLLVNTNTLFVDSTNNRVGIGTTSPAQNLHIKAPSNTNTDLFLEGNSAIGANWTIGVDDVDAGDFIISDSLGVTSNERFVIQKTSGNVGIGTSTPLQELHIKGPVGPNLDVILESPTGAGGNWTFGIDTVDAGDFIISNGTNVVSNERFVIQKTSGNIGIGTTAPAYKLDGGSNTIDELRMGRLRAGSWIGVDGSFMRIQNDNLASTLGNQALRQGGSGNTQINSASGQNLDLSINNAAKLTVHSGGNVGIGTTSPTHKLHVVGSQNLTGTLYYGTLQAQSPHAFVNKENGQLNPTEICIVSTSGNVLSVKFDDAFRPIVAVNSSSCMSKETLERVDIVYEDYNVTIDGQTVTKQREVSRTEIKSKVFG